MADKSGGIDFDRQVFVQPEAPKPRPAPIAGVLFALAAAGAIAFLAYKLLPLNLNGLTASHPTDSDVATVAELNKRLSNIDKRLHKLEVLNRTMMLKRQGELAGREDARSHPATRLYHQASDQVPKPTKVAGNSGRGKVDSANMGRLVAVQRSVATLEGDAVANRQAWQATTDKMADMTGQVGTQSVEVLRNRDELNEVLAETEMEAIPFELYRGANPQPVGPVSLALKSASQKHQRYTLCVYIQNACTELKNQALHEVVQFVVSKNSVPLRVIGTKISDDEMVGYIEVPRNSNQH